jgi:hypothetical protein
VASVNRVGGVFIHAIDPRKLGEWYSDHLGIQFQWIDDGRVGSADLFYRDDVDDPRELYQPL